MVDPIPLHLLLAIMAMLLGETVQRVMPGFETRRHHLTKFQQSLCVSNCLKILSDSVDRNSDFKDLSGSGLLANANVFQEKKFNSFCSDFVASKFCINNCGALTIKMKAILKGFEALTMICIDHKEEFIGHFPCYRSVSHEVERVCEPVCGHSPSSKGLTSNGSPVTREILLKALDAHCGFAGCQVDCQATTVYRHCRFTNGEAASEFLRKIARISFQAIQNMWRSEPGIEEMLPAKCRSLMLVSRAEHTVISPILLVICSVFYFVFFV